MSGLPTVAGYRLERLVHTDGTLHRYRAFDTARQQIVALTLLDAPGTAASAHARRLCFAVQARAAARLQHPHLVAIEALASSEEGAPCIVSQWLTDSLEQRAFPLSEADLYGLLTALLDVLGYLHAAQFLHRDIRPQQVWFADDGRVLLVSPACLSIEVDKLMELAIERTHFLSPEAARSQQLDERSDLYSLGILTFVALTGRLPFVGVDATAVVFAHLLEPVPRLPERCKHWQAWIDTALAKMPEARFQSASAMQAALPAR